MTKFRISTLTRLLMFTIIASLFIFTACEEEEEEPIPVEINESLVLAEYLESTGSPLGKYYVNSGDMPSLITATALNNDIIANEDVYIIDIRSSEAWDTAHINTAVNVAAGEVLNHVETQGLATDAKIVVVCYSGQTASWATLILRIMGYNNAYALKFGMCSWNEVFAGSWNGNIGSMYTSQFTSDATAKGATGDMPALATGKTTGQEILEIRADAVLAEGFSAAAVTNQAVYADLNNYYIVNYWGESDYTGIGHIAGAMQYTPGESIKTTADLKTLPTDKTIVVYCWTGQTSAFLTAYLRLLGYDAKSLKFGANGMIYDDLPSHTWGAGAIGTNDYWIPGS